jgi:hypothetical protein
VTLGRYAPLPGKYSDGLSRVIGQMLKLDSRSRPSADMLLKNPDVLSKLQLDETSTSFGQQASQDQHQQQALSLISTIKVPQVMRKLNSQLPKPCYPDVRPNSPTSWTVAEQKNKRLEVVEQEKQDKIQQQQQLRAARKAAPLPPVPSIPLPTMAGILESAPGPLGSGKENAGGSLYPLPTGRSSEGGSVNTEVGSKKHRPLGAAAGVAAGGYVPAPPPPPAVAGLIADHYARRPFAPAAPGHNRANIMPSHRSAAAVADGQENASCAPTGVSKLGYNKQAAYYPSSLDPINSYMTPAAAAAPMEPAAPPAIPSVAYAPNQQYAHQHQPSRPPQRLQYHHHNYNRVW